MGRNNQQRRADKKRRQAGRPTNGARAAGPWRPDVTELQAWQVESLAIRGATAAVVADREEVAGAAEALARCAQTLPPGTMTGVVGRSCARLLADRWADGWQPREVARAVGRARSARHAALVVASMVDPVCWEDAGSRPPPAPWAEQLASLGVVPAEAAGTDWLAGWLSGGGSGTTVLVDALSVVLEALGALLALPPIEPLLPVPSQWGRPGAASTGGRDDDPILVKIRALLAKAESTNFEAEADAFTAKAQELMARHAIDDAVARSEGSRSEPPVTRRVAVDDPYASAKSHLLAVVARPNGVRCVWYEDLAMMALVGFRADLDAVEVLFTSLLVQGSKAMLAKGKVRDGRGRSRTRSFRQSFLVAFADRIGERLATAATEARLQAEQELSTSLAVVLSDRAHEVEDEVTRRFPRTKRVHGPAVTNEAGWRAGRIAAELAVLGPDQQRLAGMTATG